MHNTEFENRAVNASTELSMRSYGINGAGCNVDVDTIARRRSKQRGRHVGQIRISCTRVPVRLIIVACFQCCSLSLLHRPP
jgi:hypothetical protein